jgi:hypothetical protein
VLSKSLGLTSTASTKINWRAHMLNGRLGCASRPACFRIQSLEQTLSYFPGRRKGFVLPHPLSVTTLTVLQADQSSQADQSLGRGRLVQACVRMARGASQLVAVLWLVGATSLQCSQSEQCAGGVVNLPFPSTSARVRPIESMHVMVSVDMPVSVSVPPYHILLAVRNLGYC